MLIEFDDGWMTNKEDPSSVPIVNSPDKSRQQRLYRATKLVSYVGCSML